MFFDRVGIKIFVYKDPIDMRAGFERLLLYCVQHMQAKMNEGHAYLFFGKNRSRLKILMYDGSGLVLIAKRIERKSFMSHSELLGRAEIALEELKLILHGGVLRRPVFGPEEPKSLKEKQKAVAQRHVQHSLSDAELKEESELRGLENPSADQWEEVPGSFDTLTKIQIIERSYIKEVHQKKKYRLKDEFNPDAQDVIVMAPGPDSLLPGMNYSTEVVASVEADKYVSHIPLDCQTRMMASLGLPGMRTSTLSRFCAQGAASLEDMAERIKAELLAASSRVALHLDETPWRIQNKDQKDGYMWVISNRLSSYYFFKPTRSGQSIKDRLEGFDGVVLTDACAGYNILEELGIAQGYCWAHARRKFLPVEHDDPGVKTILDDIDELFAIERGALNFAELKQLRQERSQPIAVSLRQNLMEEYPKSRSKSQKRKTIEYLLERGDGFTLFLTDIRLPLSNNEAERTIRHAVVGRKNFYGSNNHTGAETAATLYTIIESARKNQLDPRAFILMSLQRLAAGKSARTPLEYARYTRVPVKPTAG